VSIARIAVGYFTEVRMFRTSNPVLSSNAFNVENYDALEARPDSALGTTMTVQGVVNKSFFLIALTTAAAVSTWHFLANKTLAPALPALGGGLAAFVISLIICFVPRTAPWLAWVYALLKGPALAGISFIVASMLEARLAAKGASTSGMMGGAGITLVFQAVALTFGIFIALLLAYTMRIIRLSGPWKRGIIAATLGICLFYLASMVLGMFGVHIGFIWDSGPIGIAFSAFVVVLAAANLVLDFQNIEETAQSGAPKWMEWLGAVGLLMTLAWLYIEVLRLLYKLKDQK
jgi:uncharacterized YccA/Bax inhibitor family protein